MLDNKNIHELRAIAEGYGISDIFSKDISALRQAIQIKQQDFQPKPTYKPPPRPEYDSRLMTRRPTKEIDKDHVEKLLSDHIANGLVLTFPDPDRWHMRYGKKEDTGTCRMPPRVLMNCADRIMK